MGKCDICKKNQNKKMKKYQIYTGQYIKQLDQKTRTTFTGSTEIKTTNLYGNFKSHTFNLCKSCSFKHNFFIHLILLPFLFLWFTTVLPFINIETYLKWIYAFESNWILILILIGIIIVLSTYVVIKSKTISNRIIVLNWIFYLLLWFPPHSIYFIPQTGLLRLIHIISQGFLSISIPLAIYDTYGYNVHSLLKKIALESRHKEAPAREFIGLSLKQYRQII